MNFLISDTFSETLAIPQWRYETPDRDWDDTPF